MSDLPNVPVVQNINAALDIVNSRIGGKLANSQKNADTIREEVEKKWKFETVIVCEPKIIADIFFEAVQSLFFKGTLEYEKEPSKAFRHEMEVLANQKMAERQAKKDLEAKRNNDPAKFLSEHAAAEEKLKAVTAHEQAEKTAQAQIDALIANFTVNSNFANKIDGTRTQQCRAALSGIKINKDGKYSAQLTLKVLQQAYYGTTAAEIIRLAEKAKNDLIDSLNPPKGRRDSFGDDTTMIGPSGSVGGGAPPRIF